MLVAGEWIDRIDLAGIKAFIASDIIYGTIFKRIYIDLTIISAVHSADVEIYLAVFLYKEWFAYSEFRVFNREYKTFILNLDPHPACCRRVVEYITPSLIVCKLNTIVTVS